MPRNVLVGKNLAKAQSEHTEPAKDPVREKFLAQLRGEEYVPPVTETSDKVEQQKENKPVSGLRKAFDYVKAMFSKTEYKNTNTPQIEVPEVDDNKINGLIRSIGEGIKPPTLDGFNISDKRDKQKIAVTARPPAQPKNLRDIRPELSIRSANTPSNNPPPNRQDAIRKNLERLNNKDDTQKGRD